MIIAEAYTLPQANPPPPFEISTPQGFATVAAVRITNYSPFPIVLTGVGDQPSSQPVLLPYSQNVFPFKFVRGSLKAEELALSIQTTLPANMIVIAEFTDNPMEVAGNYPVSLTGEITGGAVQIIGTVFVENQIGTQLAVTGPLTIAELLATLPLPVDGPLTEAELIALLPLPVSATLAPASSIQVNNGAGAAAVNVQDGGNSLSVDDGGGSLTVDGPLTDAQLRAVPVPVTAALSPATSVQVNNAAGAAAVNVQDGGNSLSVDDGGGSLTVDGPLTDAQLRAVPVPVSGTVTVQDGGGSITVDGTVSVGNGAGAAAVNVQDGGNSLSVDDGGGSLTVDGSVSITGTVDTELPAAAAAADGAGNPTAPFIQAANDLFNEVSWDRQRGNTSFAIRASSKLVPGTENSAEFTNHNARGIQLLINVTAVAGTSPTLVVNLDELAVTPNVWRAITGATTSVATKITAAGLYVLNLYPATLTAETVPSVAVSGFLPRRFRVTSVVTGSGASPGVTFTIDAYLML